MGTIIIPCNCRSPFQDRLYGSGNRLHNVQAKDRRYLKKARCTVCSTSRGVKMNADVGEGR